MSALGNGISLLFLLNVTQYLHFLSVSHRKDRVAKFFAIQLLYNTR